MKIVLAFCCLINCFVSLAQVTFGSSPTALIELKSTSKGLLVPRMSTAARLGIDNPHEGLVVYDTSSFRLYIHQDGIWRYMINNSYWSKSSTHDALYNLSDSIGIGTSIPTARLDVNGEMRVRNDMDINDNLSIANTGNAGLLHATTTLNTGGGLIVSGNITLDSDLTLNNAAATVQIRQSGANKVYYQLSGDNLRLGTNSGNTDGSFFLRMNGDNLVWIKNNSDLVLLRYNGSVEYGKLVMGEKLCRIASPGNNMLTIMYGRIFSDGNIGTMWPSVGSCTRVGLGIYDIETNITGVSSKGTIVITPTNTNAARVCTGRYMGAGKFRVEVYALLGNHVDSDFYFIINDPLN